MEKQRIADPQMRGLVEAAVAAVGCELWDVTVSGPPGRRLLRVYIDAPGGVDLDDCTRVSRTLRPVLEASRDLADIDLEVSSPGAERHLRGMDDYRRFIGRRVNLRFRSATRAAVGEPPSDAETVVEGELSQVADDELTVLARGDRELAVPIDALIEARLAVDFGGDDRPGRPRSKR